MKKILIVNANYYNEISKKLFLNAKKKLQKKKVKIKLLEVPGVYEIPIAIRKNINKYNGFIALGCVIKGQTPHFDLICSSLFNSILDLSVTFNKPIGNGVITAYNMSQARQRCASGNTRKPNKGSEAANAVMSILENGPKKI